MKENQQLSDTPRSPGEARRQKGPVPVIAIFLALGLIVAFLLFFLPAYVD